MSPSCGVQFWRKRDADGLLLQVVYSTELTRAEILLSDVDCKQHPSKANVQIRPANLIIAVVSRLSFEEIA